MVPNALALPLSLSLIAANDAGGPDPNASAAWAAAIAAAVAGIAAVVSAIFTAKAANAAKGQTALQRELAEAATQPYVWADVQPDMKQGTILRVVVGNEGPTVATNVRVTFSPPLATPAKHPGAIEAAQRTLASGIKSMAPGRRIEWTAGAGYEVLEGDGPIRHTVTVTADGPHGPVEPLTFEIDLANWRHAADSPDGSLHLVRRSIDNLGKRLAAITQGSRLQVSAEVREASEEDDEE